MKKVKIRVKRTEQNENADGRLSVNGGGYSQPLYELETTHYRCIIDDTSCGDFGDRVYVKINKGNLVKFEAYYDSMSNSESWCQLSNRVYRHSIELDALLKKCAELGYGWNINPNNYDKFIIKAKKGLKRS